jgi:glycosyltransferase involved in cell wall biosynthesis
VRLLKVLPRRFFWRLGLDSGYGVEQTTFALRLLPQLRRDRIDVLHVKDPWVAYLMQRCRSLGLVRCRTILSHGTDEPPEFLRHFDYVQHLAPWHLEAAREAGAWKPTWTAIPNFIDTDRFASGRAETLRDELGIPRDGLVVLTASAIKRGHKRVDYLMEEFARLRQRAPALPVWLVIAGGREADTDELQAMGRQLLGDRVRFLVSYPLSRMPELYRSADLFVLGSLKEMLGTVLLEASASAVPCIGHQFPVTAWVIGPGGQTADLSVPGALTAAMEAVLSNPEQRRQLGALARQHCLATFSRERVVEQYLEYYRFVLANEPQASRKSRLPTVVAASSPVAGASL